VAFDAKQQHQQEAATMEKEVENEEDLNNWSDDGRDP
jgi:hypothetical protein